MMIWKLWSCLILLALFHQSSLKNAIDSDTAIEPEHVFVSLEEQQLCLLIEEAGSRGVLDTACSRSVAGFIWVQNYTNSVSPEFSKSLKVLPSTKIYQFGGDERRQSHGKLSLPVVLGDKKITITIEMVDAQIPLLIGSYSMKLGNAVINFQNNTSTFLTRWLVWLRLEQDTSALICCHQMWQSRKIL